MSFDVRALCVSVLSILSVFYNLKEGRKESVFHIVICVFYSQSQSHSVCFVSLANDAMHLAFYMVIERRLQFDVGQKLRDDMRQKSCYFVFTNVYIYYFVL